MKALSRKTTDLIAREDAKLNKKCGYSADQLKENVNVLMQFGRIEVGVRESCGVTDPTMFVWRGWQKVLVSLRKDGFDVMEEPQKHGNSWATKGGGFWKSTVYRLASPVSEVTA